MSGLQVFGSSAHRTLCRGTLPTRSSHCRGSGMEDFYTPKHLLTAIASIKDVFSATKLEDKPTTTSVGKY